jgi:signal peptidase
LLVAWFFLLRPESLGGQASYVIVAGRSMEPTLQMHDLAIVRKRDSYGVGDVIAFRADGGEVIHRIVGGDASGGFVVRGDNNESPDLWRPRPPDIKGAMWWRVPGAGHALEFLLQPVNLAIVVGSLATFWLMVGRETKLRRRSPRRGHSRAGPAGQHHGAGDGAPTRTLAGAALGFLVLLGLGLTAAATHSFVQQARKAALVNSRGSRTVLPVARPRRRTN